MVSGVSTGEALADGRWDPLAGVRAAGSPQLDVLLTGSVFLDLVFTGLADVPTPGTEIWADGMGSSPGGICNLAVAASRLGLRTGLAAGFGADVYGDWCWDVLSRQEHVDLSLSRQFADTHSAVTVSVAHSGDRSMITHGHPVPMSADELIGRPPASAAAIAELSLMLRRRRHRTVVASRPRRRARGCSPTSAGTPPGSGTSRPWRRSGSCHAFMPNEVEAMAYTRTDSPQAALHALADRVPLAVVTCGADGALAIDASTGEQAQVPALSTCWPSTPPAPATCSVPRSCSAPSPDGRWTIGSRSPHCVPRSRSSSSAVRSSAPGWGDISDWWSATRRRTDGSDADVVDRYRFLDTLVPPFPVRMVRRAHATIATQSDLPEARPRTVQPSDSTVVPLRPPHIPSNESRTQR